VKNVASNARFWIAGTAIALAGVVVARAVAPLVDGSDRIVLTVGGQLLALGGLFLICLGVRRRIKAAAKE
jgi:hypothetical protein